MVPVPLFNVRPALCDLGKFADALVRGDDLSKASRAEMTRPGLHMATAHQFPPFLADLPLNEQRKDLYATLAWASLVFEGPQATASTKAATTVRPQTAWSASRPVSVASSSCRTMFAPRRASPNWSDLFLGNTGVPYDWEYGDHGGKL